MSAPKEQHLAASFSMRSSNQPLPSRLAIIGDNPIRVTITPHPSVKMEANAKCDRFRVLSGQACYISVAFKLTIDSAVDS